MIRGAASIWRVCKFSKLNISRHFWTFLNISRQFSTFLDASRLLVGGPITIKGDGENTTILKCKRHNNVTILTS